MSEIQATPNVTSTPHRGGEPLLLAPCELLAVLSINPSPSGSMLAEHLMLVESLLTPEELRQTFLDAGLFGLIARGLAQFGPNGELGVDARLGIALNEAAGVQRWIRLTDHDRQRMVVLAEGPSAAEEVSEAAESTVYAAAPFDAIAVDRLSGDVSTHVHSFISDAVREPAEHQTNDSVLTVDVAHVADAYRSSLTLRWSPEGWHAEMADELADGSRSEPVTLSPVPPVELADVVADWWASEASETSDSIDVHEGADA